MNRIVNCLLIGIFLLIVGINRVNASVYNGKLYEVWDTESGVNVYGAESNGYMDYNSWMIKSTADDKIYYCIDPTTLLFGSSAGSHNLYTDKAEIISKTALTEAKYKKVQLLSYYGYGYKDEYVDHTNKKWYGITQVMIWRVMRPDLTWTFKKTRNGVASNSNFASEVAEMNNLVNSYSTLPSFANKTFIVKSGEKIVLEDTNKVFHKYTLTQSSKKVILTKSGDRLALYSEYSTPYRLGYKIASKTNEKFGALVSSDYQDIIRMGAPEEQSFYFTLEVDGGFLEVQKLDKETTKNIPQGDASFEGAKYEIYNSNNEKVATVTTDKNGLGKVGLDYGNYTMKEVVAPKGYTLSDEIYSFTLNGKDDHIKVNVSDKVIKGNVKLLKTKGGAGEEFTYEKGSTFNVIDKDGNVIEKIRTDNKGIAMVTLPYGKYEIHQTSGADGYVFTDDIVIELYEEKTYEVNVKNLKHSKLVFSKLDFSTDNPIPNTLVEIYKEDDTLVSSCKTDKSGKCEITDLEIGKYYILEKDAPKYYRLNEEKMPFEVKENGKIVKATMHDNRKEGSLKIIKKDAESGKALKGAEFDIYFMETGKVMFKAVTDNNGEININTLVAGKYCISEIKAPKGYKVSKEKNCFEIDEDGKNINLVIKNNKETIFVPKTSAFNIVPIMASLFIVIGSSYFVYAKNN